MLHLQAKVWLKVQASDQDPQRALDKGGLQRAKAKVVVPVVGKLLLKQQEIIPRRTG